VDFIKSSLIFMVFVVLFISFSNLSLERHRIAATIPKEMD
jgi:hypothetical protein